MSLANLFCRECIPVMPAWDFAIYTGLSAIGALFFLRRCQKQFHRSRLVADMPTSKVRSASQGYTELIGIARKNNHTNIAPLSGELCLWWRYTIEKYRHTGKNRRWVTVEDKRSSLPFQLDDTTGTCRVEPKDAEVSTYHKHTWYGSTRKAVIAASKPKKSHFTMNRIGGFGRRYRYTEYLLKDGDPLYVLGHFSTDNHGVETLTPAQLAGDILRHWKLDYPSLLERFDINKDGELSNDEWQLARHAAKWQAEDERKDALTHPATSSISKPEHQGLPFIISSHEQTKLSIRFRNSARFSAIGFLVAGSLNAWLLSSRFL